MTRRLAIAFSASAALALAAHPLAKDKDEKKPERTLSKNERVEFFRTAQVWTPTNPREFDFKAGPPLKGAFKPDEYVECDFVETKPEGSSRKFHCKLSDGDDVKVR